MTIKFYYKYAMMHWFYSCIPCSILCGIFGLCSGVVIETATFASGTSVPDHLRSTAFECAAQCLRAGKACSGYEITDGSCRLLSCDSENTEGAELKAEKDIELPALQGKTIRY